MTDSLAEFFEVFAAFLSSEKLVNFKTADGVASADDVQE